MNGWLLCHRHCEQKKLSKKNVLCFLQFQSKVKHALLFGGKAKAVCNTRRRGLPLFLELQTASRTSHSSATTAGPPVPQEKAQSYSTASPVPDNNVKLDCIGHFPLFGKKQHRCRHCPKGYSCVYCSKCNTYLCLVKDRNCFCDFHVRE